MEGQGHNHGTTIEVPLFLFFFFFPQGLFNEKLQCLQPPQMLGLPRWQGLMSGAPTFVEKQSILSLESSAVEVSLELPCHRDGLTAPKMQ